MLSYTSSNMDVVSLWKHIIYKFKLYILQSTSKKESSNIVTLMASIELYLGIQAFSVAPSHTDPGLGRVMCFDYWHISKYNKRRDHW